MKEKEGGRKKRRGRPYRVLPLRAVREEKGHCLGHPPLPKRRRKKKKEGKGADVRIVNLGPADRREKGKKRRPTVYSCSSAKDRKKEEEKREGGGESLICSAPPLEG